MMTLGSRIEEAGLLLQERDIYLLRRDIGGRLQLDLHRITAPTPGQRVQIIGVLVGPDLVDVSVITPERG